MRGAGSCTNGSGAPRLTVVMGPSRVERDKISSDNS